MITGFTEDGFILKTKNGEEVIKADCAIVSIGYNSEKSLYEDLKFKIPNLHLLGDASQVSNIMYAIWNAYEVARNI